MRELIESLIIRVEDGDITINEILGELNLLKEESNYIDNIDVIDE